MTQKLLAAHPIFLALGPAMAAFAVAGLPMGSRAQMIVGAAGTALTTFGGVLARYWQKPGEPAPAPAPEVKP